MTVGGFRVAVLGPGGVGGLLAAVLARSGNRVLVIAGEDTARAITRDGIQLQSKTFGDFDVRVETATRLSEPVDACLVAVKATHLRDAVSRVPAEALRAGLVIPFLNGLEHVEFLRSIYGPTSVAAATIRVEAFRVGPGVIRQTSAFVGIEIARSEANRNRVDAIASHLSSAGLDVKVRDDELAMLWEKFALLEPFALLSTHERANAGAIRARRRADVVALFSEAAAVAASDGVVIDRDALIRFFDSLPESMESSMQRDQAAGRPLELDALGGALLRRAKKAGIAAPVTARLVEDLRRSDG
ncbi:MAG TPA: 2-dehydropantoate 2-reductase [Candidatus Dormibacteraeota bacterium]|nr:2-dehydropantoate 2-reductase [Candidatus Dormibacteraeota bacterium]